MGKGMCEFKSSPKEIEHSNENKAIFIFLDFLCSHFFFNSYFAQFNIFFIFFQFLLGIF
jgi:hypothetical protein